MSDSNRKVIEDYLRFLFDEVPGEYCIDIRAFNDRKSGAPQTSMAPSIAHAVQRLARLSQDSGTGVFVGVSPRKVKEYRGKAGGAADVLGTTVVWADLDTGEGKPHESKEAARSHLNACVLAGSVPKPSLVVDSGGGLHIYWRIKFIAFDDPQVDPHEHLHYKVQSGLATQLRGDRAVSDRSRILRVPGTKNWKQPIPRQVQVLEQNRVCYELEEFAQIAAQASRVAFPQTASVSPSLMVTGGGADAVEAILKAADAEEAAAHRGKGAPPKSRLRRLYERDPDVIADGTNDSAVDWALACELYRRGCSVQTTSVVLLHSRTDHKVDVEKKGKDYFTNTARQAWDRYVAEQVLDAGEYFRLARLLRPTAVKAAADAHPELFSVVSGEVEASEKLDLDALLHDVLPPSSVLPSGDTDRRYARGFAESDIGLNYIQEREGDAEAVETHRFNSMSYSLIGRSKENTPEVSADFERYIDALRNLAPYMPATRVPNVPLGGSSSGRSINYLPAPEVLRRNAHDLEGRNSSRRVWQHALAYVRKVDKRDFDSDPHELCTPDGIVNLETGDIRPHSRESFVRHHTTARWRPDATCEMWDDYIKTVVADDEERLWLQAHAGSALCGVVPKRIAVLFAPPDTGKSMFLRILAATLGTYAVMPKDGFLVGRDLYQSDPNSPSAYLECLRNNPRLVYVSDPNKTLVMGGWSKHVKPWLGGDMLIGRSLYASNEFRVTPHGTLFLATNDLVAETDGDSGMAGKVCVVNFGLPEEKLDRTYEARLLEQPLALEAVLAWLYEGYKMQVAQKFNYPATESMKDLWKSQEYASEQKKFALLTSFIQQELVRDARSEIPMREVLRRFSLLPGAPRGTAGGKLVRVYNERYPDALKIMDKHGAKFLTGYRWRSDAQAL